MNPENNETPTQNPAPTPEQPITPINMTQPVQVTEPVADTSIDLQEPPKEGGKVGPIIGIVIIILIIILGGLYIWGQRLVQQEHTEITETPEITENITEEPLQEREDLGSIETELDTTDIDSLEADLGELEAEL